MLKQLKKNIPSLAIISLSLTAFLAVTAVLVFSVDEEKQHSLFIFQKCNRICD